MAPSTRIISRDTTPDNSGSTTVTPVVIAGLALAGAVILSLCLWLGIRTYRKRSGRSRANSATSNGGEKAISQPRHVPFSCEPLSRLTVAFGRSPSIRFRIAVNGIPNPFSRDHLTASVVLPHKNVLPPNATKDEILQYHIASGTMTRPFLVASGGGSTLAPPRPHSPTGTTAARPISTVSFVSAAGRSPSPRRTSFFGFGGGSGGSTSRPMSVASTFSTVSSVFGGGGRKVRQLFSPVLPDELVVSLSEKLMVIKTFDDGWCIVGRDSLLKPGEAEMGAVPSWCFVKPVKGLKASRPMRTTSLGVTVEIESGPGFSSRDELISWSNF